jgi:transcription factor SPN1
MSEDEHLDSLGGSPEIRKRAHHSDSGNEDNENSRKESDTPQIKKKDKKERRAGREDEGQKVKEMTFDKDQDDASDGSGVIDYYDEGDETEYKRKTKKKSKNREKSTQSKSRKKTKKNEEAEEDFVEGTESDVERELEKRAKKAKKKKAEEDVAQNDVENLIKEMEFAYKEDIECYENQKPALNKLKLLPKVEYYLKRQAHQEQFVEQGLMVMAKWLTKLPNGAAPALPLRKKLVEVIQNLPVSEEQIKTCDIGKILFEMKSNPNEDPELRRVLKDLIDKWTRILIDIPADYRDYKEDSRNVKRVGISLDELRTKRLSDLRKSIPRLTNRKSGFDFVKKPQSQLKEDSKGVVQMRTGGMDECDKLIFDLKRKIKKEFK